MNKTQSDKVAEQVIHDFIIRAEMNGWAGIIYITPNPDPTKPTNRCIGFCIGQPETLPAVMFQANTKVKEMIEATKADEAVKQEKP